MNRLQNIQEHCALWNRICNYRAINSWSETSRHERDQSFLVPAKKRNLFSVPAGPGLLCPSLETSSFNPDNSWCNRFDFLVQVQLFISTTELLRLDKFSWFVKYSLMIIRIFLNAVVNLITLDFIVVISSSSTWLNK